MNQAYKNIRHFIYLNVKAQYRSEGYRLVKKLMEETETNAKQRALLDEKLKGRKQPEGWIDDAGAPALREDAR